MAVLPILWAPDPVLKARCDPVPGIDSRVRRLIDDMIDTMHAADGIGLAAPQVGVKRRIAVIGVDLETGKRAEPFCMINPEIVVRSDTKIMHNEGCLSLPGHYAEVTRPATVRIRYQDCDGAVQERDAEGMAAICTQHEIDHLDGILFVDHLSSLKRNMIMRKMVKAKKLRGRDNRG